MAHQDQTQWRGTAQQTQENTAPTAQAAAKATAKATAGARALIVVNDPESGPRGIPQVLLDQGIAADVIDATQTPLPDSLQGYAGFVMLGGGLMPDEDEHAPWLVAERRLAAEAIAQDIPTLGICLGAQILALVGGGTVQANGPAPERGATPIDLKHEARTDPLFSDVPQQTFFMENHRDFIETLPANAVLLASSARCEVQAFRMGEKVWGVQFHPEVPPERALEFDPARLASDGFDSEQIVAFAREHADQVRASSSAVLATLARIVHAHELSTHTA